MKDETFEVTLDKLTYGGDAIGRLPDSRAVFVPFAIPGERVRLRLVEEKPRFARAELIEVLEPSSLRITPRCPHFQDCGGCAYQHLSYPSQLKFKTDILRDQLNRIGRIPDPPIQPIQPSPQPWNYRNHIQFHLNEKGRLGFFASGSNRVVPVNECHLPEELLNALWPELDFESGTGVEEVSLRLGDAREILVMLAGRTPETPILELESGISVVHQYKEDSWCLQVRTISWFRFNHPHQPRNAPSRFPPVHFSR